MSFDDIYESIRTIEIQINQNNKHVTKLIDEIKFLKIDNNRLIRDLNLLKLKVNELNMKLKQQLESDKLNNKIFVKI